MDFPLFAKLLVSVCTVGGGSVGAYVAGFMGNNNSELREQGENQHNLVEQEGQHPSSKAEGSSDNTKETEDNKDQSSEADEQQRKSQEQVSSSETNSNPTSAELNSQNHEQKDEPSVTSSTPTEPFRFENQEFQSILDGSEDVSDQENSYEEELDEQVSQESEDEETFGSFEDYEKGYYRDDSDDEEEGISNPSSLFVAEYIEKKGENQQGEALEVTCEDWTTDSWGELRKKSEVSKSECDYRKKRDIWSKKGGSQPTVWLNVEQTKAKKILEKYGLWKGENSKFTTQKQNRWFTEKANFRETEGKWDCNREYSEHNSKNFLISCDFFIESQNTR
ncbi:hypothetical protein [Mycoplasma suis]|uniref:Uncharacterized protein n=1 Tax=Mycoplasma suis (strain Illinois) TaxID=768700 RepID=F0QQM2_MYCSL|nr:hypothetical protein [Mycoplasma suis]ADX97792.1 hypothetical protein MSU_0248 [Mycoplasma suis str. Illinois]